MSGPGVPGVEVLLLDEATPAFGHDIALAAAPVRVAEPPGLAGAVLEAEQQAIVGGGGVQREVLLGVLLQDHQPVQLPHVGKAFFLAQSKKPKGRWRRRGGSHASNHGASEEGAKLNT